MKQQIFIDDIYEYDYEEITQGDVIYHILYFSNTEQWNDHIKGKIAMTIEDDENGLKVYFDENGRIDYAEAERLFILLKLINPVQKYEIGTKKLL
jgi:hypothetical protein